MNWIADIIDTHRRLVCGLIIVLTVVALVGISRLDYSMNPSSDIRGDDADWKVVKEFYEEFDPDGQACVVLLKTDNIFTPEAITALRQLASRIRKSKGVTQVYSIDDVPVISGGIPHRLLPAGQLSQNILQQARAEALVHPLAAGQLISPNAATAVVIVRLNELSTINDLFPMVVNIRRIARTVAAEHGLEVFVTGSPALTADWFTEMRSQRIRLPIIACCVTLIIGMLLLRNFSAVIITSTPHIFGTIWTLGAMGWLGIELTMLGSAMPALLTAIGFTDSVHLMLHMRREVGAGSSARSGAILAIRRIGIACALTSLTTAVGFGSLLLASRPSVRDFGGCCAMGCVLTFIAVMTFVPLLSGTFLGGRCAAAAKAEQMSRWNNYFDLVSRRVSARAMPITIFSVLIIIALTATALKLKRDVDIQFYPPQSDSMRAMDIFKQDFGGGGMIHAWVDWRDPNDVLAGLVSALKDVHTIFDDDPFTSYPMSALNLVQSIGVQPKETRISIALLSLFPKDLVDRFIHFDHGCAVVNAKCPILGASASVPALSRIERSLAELSEKYEPLRFRLTGVPLVISRSLHKINIDLARSLGLAAVIIFGIITLEFRSFRYGAICLIPNIFPLAVISAYLFFTGQSLQTMTVLVFTICLGIAVDDTIHFMTRFRTEFRECGNAHEAVKHSFRAVGKALVVTTIIFMFCFGTCATSTIPMTKNFAYLACIGFAAALAGDLIILPALLLVFFRRRARRHQSEAIG
ncbi:MAG: efflux RND transporter permease subunit [Planctomycetota bacterium]